jgi:hypothetical protein
MRMNNTFAAVVCLALIPLNLSYCPPQKEQPDACGLIQEALADYGHIKVGATRADVARYFTPDGGMQFPSPTRYVHPKCNYLHVNVEFEVKKPTGVSFSPEDKVVSVSKL